MAILTRTQHVRLGSISRGTLVAISGASVGLLVAALLIACLATQFWGYHVLTVQSGSMEPALSRGSIVVTRPIRGDKVQRGDVILYRLDNGMSIIHRVTGINRITLNLIDSKTGESDTAITHQFTTRGDANASPDRAAVDERAVDGKLWLTVPAISGLPGGLDLRWFFVGAAVGLTATWAGWESTRWKRSRQRREDGE